MVDDEKLGYHKGALKSLVNERMELARLLQIVNSLVEKHVEALDEMGVDVEEFLEKIQQRQRERVKKSKKKGKKDKEEGKKYDLSKEELPD